MVRLAFIISCCLAFATCAFGQDERITIDKSLIPAEANNLNRFVPAGWKIEEKIAGDLNGDAQPDYALKLIEDKPDKDKDGNATERYRALVLVLQEQDGKFSRAGVADKLLQCTGCGGAFYGVVEAPANVKIQKGVIVVDQDHGSRDLTNTTYRFRYDADTQRFILIGFDFADADRLTAKVVAESTNYLTGVRKTSRGKADTISTITKKKVFIDDVDFEQFEEAAVKRLHLD